MFGTKKTAVNTDKIEVGLLLNKWVEEVFVKESLEKKLLSGKVLRIKLGFDPTGPKVHIGRAIVLRKLRDFQRLGHQVVFIVGDFTAKIGDPSDKLEKRPTLSQKQIEENLKDYKKQIGKIIDLERTEFHYNSRWLSKLNLEQITELAESFSVSQMAARRNFKERLEKNDEVSLREFLYPLMQGYDSVAVKADVEIGGFDQLFNLKAGRTVQKHYNSPEQDIITTEMLLGTDGRKMSTSWGNVINITDEPSDMFGKVMSIKDDLITKYYYLCTDMMPEEIDGISQSLKSGKNPRDHKMRLAEEIVKIYHGEKASVDAANNFKETFSGGNMPKEMPEVKVEKGVSLGNVLVGAKIVSSKSEFRRLIGERAITTIGGETIVDPNYIVKGDLNLRVGKHRFIRIVPL